MQKKKFSYSPEVEWKQSHYNSSLSTTSFFPFPLHSTLDSFNWYILITFISFPHLFRLEFGQGWACSVGAHASLRWCEFLCGAARLCSQDVFLWSLPTSSSYTLSTPVQQWSLSLWWVGEVYMFHFSQRTIQPFILCPLFCCVSLFYQSYSAKSNWGLKTNWFMNIRPLGIS